MPSSESNRVRELFVAGNPNDTRIATSTITYAPDVMAVVNASTNTTTTYDYFAQPDLPPPSPPPNAVQSDLARLSELLTRERTPRNLTRSVERIWRRCRAADVEYQFWSRVMRSRHSNRWSPCDSRPGRLPHLVSADYIDFSRDRMCRACGQLSVRCPSCGVYYWRDNEVEVARHAHAELRVPGTRALAQRLPRFGVELELEFRRREAEDTLRFERWVGDAAADWASWVHDGSLFYGVEIRSDPLTLAQHLDGRWSSLFEFADGVFKGEHDHPVGMHVHVSRNVLGVGQIGRLLSFVNSPRNSGFMTALAGRSANEFCSRGKYGYRARYAAKGLIHAKGCPAMSTEGRALCHCQVHANRRQGDRYKALNLATGNKATIEFRLFASTTEERRFLANLQAVAALIHWSAEESWERLNWQDYLAWLQDTPNRAYREHRLHLASLGHDQFAMRLPNQLHAPTPAPRKVCV